MLCRLFTLLSAASLAPFAATAAAWLLGPNLERSAIVRVDGHPRGIALRAVPGGLRLVVRHALVDRTTLALHPSNGVGFESHDVRLGWLGFGSGRVTRLSGPVLPPQPIYEDRVFGARYAPLLPATGLPPGVAAVAAYRRRRAARRGRDLGLCQACGYDLRATPERGGTLLARCPECGAPPAGGG